MLRLIKKILKWGSVIAIILLILASCGKKKNENSDAPLQAPRLPESGQTRSFYMGFQPWPADLTSDAINDAYAFIAKHGDLISHHLDNGVPWPEAFENKEFPKHLRDEWQLRKSKTPKTSVVFLSMNPINPERNGMAKLWGETGDAQNLPSPWNSYALNDPSVKQAFLNYVKKGIDYFNPKYLAIGMEVNNLISSDPKKWQEYKELHEFVYTELKKDYPNLPIFATIQYDHLRGTDEGAKKNKAMQISEVKELLLHSDILVLSFYKYDKDHNDIGNDFFNFAKSFNKPLSISEFGGISRQVKASGKTFNGTEADQMEFVTKILELATKEKFVFVVHFLTSDFDKMVSKLPPEWQDFSKVASYMGLINSDGSAKPALRVWDGYFKLRKK